MVRLYVRACVLRAKPFAIFSYQIEPRGRGSGAPGCRTSSYECICKGESLRVGRGDMAMTTEGRMSSVT